jgi:DNA-binding Lrp family transcriptional regulator
LEVEAMDEVDIALILTLLTNSRTPYQELAKRLNLSVNAVHKRVQSLIDEGVIASFTARPHLIVLDAFDVLVYGKSDTASIRDTMKRLSENDSIYWVAAASGSYLFVGCYIRNMGELEHVSEFIRENGEMPEPRVGILNLGIGAHQVPRNAFDELDWQIIYQLKDDSRKPLAEIAEAINVSAKTVRRHLGRMMSSYYVDLSIKWFPDKGNDIITIFHVKTSAARRIDPMEIAKKYAPNLLFTMIFSNLPGEYLLVTWTRNMKELRYLGNRIEGEVGFESVWPNILYTGEIYPTWREKMIEEHGKPPRLAV